MESGVINIRSSLDALGVSWLFGGPVEDGTEACWNDVSWEDPRTKPTWAELVAAALIPAKALKLDAIHAEKNRARDSGFLVNGMLFDSDLPARTSYAELAIAFQHDPTFTTSWKASDGVWVNMDLTLFQRVYAEGRAHIERCFAWQEEREREVSEAQTMDEVAAVHAVME